MDKYRELASKHEIHDLWAEREFFAEVKDNYTEEEERRFVEDQYYELFIKPLEAGVPVYKRRTRLPMLIVVLLAVIGVAAYMFYTKF